ncbi:MAG TPA: DinB family protein [Gemmatimonadaceae bacterium]|jgi:hypothetical protein
MTTPSIAIARPLADEHSEYFGKYVQRVPKGDVVSLLREQLMDTVALLRNVSAEKADYAYAPGKWTIKDVVGHLADTERVMSYRALAIARGDQTPLPSFDENAYVANANFGSRTLGDLLEEFQVVRASTIHLIKHLDEQTLMQRGTASNNPLTVRALIYIIAGHERHHVALFRERYLA